MRTGSLCLLIAVFLCSAAYGQDSTGHAVQTVSAAPDSSRVIVPDTQRTVSVLTHTADTVSKREVMSAPESEVRAGYSAYWLAGAGFLGLLVGAFGYMLLFSKKERAAVDSISSTESNIEEETEQAARMEQRHNELHAQNTRLMAENEQLKSDNTELQQLLHNANTNSDMSDNGMAKEIMFYMPQPNMNGRFQEASRRTDAANALYAFHMRTDQPELASFEFIAKDAYLNAAIGNEPSWIAIACDRTNQPTASTTGVRTDIPGTVQLKDGEWEIIRKAKITYL